MQIQKNLSLGRQRLPEESMTKYDRYEEKKFDKRLIERHLNNGLECARITEDELKAYLDALPDLADKCEPVTVEQPIFAKPEETEENTSEENN